jgi:hypothetical protein
VVSTVLIALAHAGTALAGPPSVSITSPLNGSVIINPTPSFSGEGEAGSEVTLEIYEGHAAEGTAIRKMQTAFFLGSTWFTEPVGEPLNDGTYTARATQTNDFLEPGESTPVTFTVETARPAVTLNSPESPSDNTTPSFTGTASEKALVTVQIHAGGTVDGTLVSRATASGTGAGWTSGNASPALPTGEYTAVATQENLLGAGRSAPVTFAVTPPPIAAPELVLAPPTAAFTWFPPMPQTGESVSLVSSSSDASSPITALAWSLASTDPFESGGTVLSTSFSTPGPHAVRLRVTNAAGLASVATETIDVLGHTTPLMQPFPVVRIAGTYNAKGVKLRLLRVQQMPAGARVTVRCKGHGCPLKSVSRLAASTGQAVAQIEFKRFEHWLPAGVSLEILVAKQGEIGKYTRFRTRRAKPPERVDMCLEAMGTKPLACPGS